MWTELTLPSTEPVHIHGANVRLLLTHVNPAATAPPLLTRHNESIEFEAAGGGEYGTWWWRLRGPLQHDQTYVLLNACDTLLVASQPGPQHTLDACVLDAAEITLYVDVEAATVEPNFNACDAESLPPLIINEMAWSAKRAFRLLCNAQVRVCVTPALLDALEMGAVPHWLGSYANGMFALRLGRCYAACNVCYTVQT